MIGTIQLILGHGLFLSLSCNWPCVIDIFSFVQFLYFWYWLIYLKSCPKKHLYFQVHSGYQAIQTSSLYTWKAFPKAFPKFQLKSYEDVLEIPESFFKHHTVFPLTLAVSNIYHRAIITQQQNFGLV